MKISRREVLLSSMGLLGTAALGRVAEALPLHALNRDAAPVESLAARLARDPRRPQYHLLPKANWMNDPNGPVYWKGNYHMFFQYNPEGAYWGDMHWGHAVSRDMIHWRHLPVALAPTPGGPDAAGCFTGTSVIDDDRVAVVYTGVVSAAESAATIRNGAQSLRESQCLAWGTGDELTHWVKDARPVIAAPPEGLDVSGFRDPSPWRQGDAWYTVVGSGIRGKEGMVLLYRSRDLHTWEYLHPLVTGAGNGKVAANPVDAGDMWECPDFFPLGGKYVLIHSTAGKSYWQSGVLDTSAMIFHPEQGGVLDHGSFYAAKSQRDADGDRILWGWVPETRPEKAYRAAGWAGLMSLPRRLTLDANGVLRIEVSGAVNALREPEQVASTAKRLADLRIEDCCGEVTCSAVRGAKEFTLRLGPADSSVAWLECDYNPARSDVMLMDGKAVPAGAGAKAELRIFVDGSVMEVFVNGRSAYTKRFYYSGDAAPLLGAQWSGDAKSLTGISMRQMRPISSDRLTT